MKDESMKPLQLFFFSILMLAQVINANIQQDMQPKIKAASLQATCTIKIMQEKLSYANKEKNFDPDEFASIFKKLYDECNAIINNPDNSPKQPNLSENDWINKSFREIKTLHQNNETRYCFNQAVSKLKQLAQASTEDEKDIIIKSFFKDAEDCSYQYALKLSMPHLEGQITRWENNKDNYRHNFNIFSTFIKHTPHEQDDLEADLQKLYTARVHSITFEEFADNMKNDIARIQKDQNGRQCLQDLINFKSAYDAIQSSQAKEDLKKAFAIQYFQCKNK